MSTYLSPIASSGDSTPPNEEQEERRLIERAAIGSSAGQQQQLATQQFGSGSSCELIGAGEVDDDDDDDSGDDDQEDELALTERLRAGAIRAKLQPEGLASNQATRSSATSTTNNNSQQPVNNAERRGRSLNGQQLIQNCYSKTGEQLHKLFQSASATLKEANINPSEYAAAGGAQATLAKRLRRIAQAIPIVPLVATSIMTVVILCFLLLSNTLMVATASGNSGPQRPPAPPQALAQATGRLHHHRHHHRALGAETGPPAPLARQSESLTLEPADGAASPGSPSSDLDGGEAQPTPHRLALRRDLIESLLQQQHHHHHHLLPAAATTAVRLHSSKRHSLGAEQEQEQHQQPDGGAGSDGASQQQARGFDSLGAMLLGAAPPGDEQASEDSPAHEQDESAAAGDGPPELGHRRAASRGPARLLAAPLLQVHLDNLDNLDSPIDGASGPAGGQQARAARLDEHKQAHSAQQHRHLYSTSSSSKHQHGNTRRPYNNQPQQFEPRRFDVAQIQCNNTEEGFERFACPSPDDQGRYRCIEDRLFCDGYYDCPNGEDEERVSCMYYKLFVSHIDILTNTFLTWMKKQNQLTNQAQNLFAAGGGATDEQANNSLK